VRQQNLLSDSNAAIASPILAPHAKSFHPGCVGFCRPHRASSRSASSGGEMMGVLLPMLLRWTVPRAWVAPLVLRPTGSACSMAL